MKIPPKDFDMTLREISKWHDEWKKERFGSDSLTPDRYYNITEDGRYLYGVREGESLNDEKDDCEKVLDILCRLRLINQKLMGRGLSSHLQRTEREQLKKEREGLYNEFLDMIKQPQNLNPEPQPQILNPEPYLKKRRCRPTKELKDMMIDDEDGNKLQKIHNAMAGKKGKIAALIILACILKGWMAKPTFTQVKNEFGDVGTQQGFTKYLNGQ